MITFKGLRTRDCELRYGCVRNRSLRASYVVLRNGGLSAVEKSIAVYLRHRLTITLDIAAVHTLGVKAKLEVAFRVKGDHAAAPVLVVESRFDRLVDSL